MTPSRRTFLSALGSSSIAFTGCTGVQQNAPANETTHRTKTAVDSTHDTTPRTTTAPTETTSVETTTSPTPTTTPTETTTSQETTPERSVFEISEIQVLNLVREPHEFHVLILEGETPVFWRSYEAEAAEWEDGRVSSATGTVWDDPVSGPGRYAMYARVDNRETWERWIPTDADGWCINWEVNYGTEGLYFMYSHCE